MIVAVAIKRVPDTTTKVKVGPDGLSLHPEGVGYVINPYDEYAIEEALRIKDKDPSTEVVGLTVDPEGNETILRKALAMGVDRGILLKGGPWMDGLPVARALAAELKNVKFDLLLFGKQAVDDDASQVPSLVAHLAGVPLVNTINAMEYAGGRVTCRRPIEGAEEVYEVPTPCALSITKNPHEPRYPTLKGIMAAKKKPVEVKEAAAGAPAMEILKMEMPPERPAGKIVGHGKEAVAELVRLLRQEAKVL